MSGFRVVYSRGSFAFAITCDTREQALARAVSISHEAGVWHVHVEEAAGMRAVLPDIVGNLRSGIPTARPLRGGEERSRRGRVED